MTRACGMRRTRHAAVAPPQTSPPHLPATSWRRVRREHETLCGSAYHCLQTPWPPRPRPAAVAAPLLAARACTHVMPYHNFIPAGPHESLLRVSTVSEGVTASPLCPLRTAPSASCGRVQRTLGLNHRPSQCQGCRCRRRVERTHCGDARPELRVSAGHPQSHSASHTAAAISTFLCVHRLGELQHGAVQYYAAGAVINRSRRRPAQHLSRAPVRRHHRCVDRARNPSRDGGKSNPASPAAHRYQNRAARRAAPRARATEAGSVRRRRASKSHASHRGCKILIAGPMSSPPRVLCRRCRIAPSPPVPEMATNTLPTQPTLPSTPRARRDLGGGPRRHGPLLVQARHPVPAQGHQRAHPRAGGADHGCRLTRGRVCVDVARAGCGPCDVELEAARL